jgi:hypothetical protein
MSAEESPRRSGRAARGEWIRLALALAAYALLAVVYLRPIWRLFDSQLTQPVADPLFNLCLLKWVAHEIPRHFAGFWDAPFFYPERNITAHSDHLLGPGLVAAGFTTLVPSFVAAMNFLVLSSFALCGATTCFVLRRCGLGWLAALAGGCMFAFAPFRWEHLSHVQMLQMQWIPLTLWTFDRLLARATPARAVAFLVCYLLHLGGGVYLAYMIHVPLFALLVSRLAARLRGAERAAPREWLVWSATAATAATAAGALFVPYWRSGLTWGTEVQRIWGASVLSYLQPSSRNLYAALWPAVLQRPENALFPGWCAAAFGVAGLWSLWRRFRNPPIRNLLVRSSPVRSSPVRNSPVPNSPAPARNSPVRIGVRSAVLISLLLAALVGLVLGELHTWSKLEGFAGLDRYVPGHGYRLPLVLLCVGLGGWLLLRRAWGGWPLRFGGMDPWERGLLLSTLLTVALSHPIIYSKAVHLLPGLRSMRVPTRFHAFTLFSLVWFASRLLDRLAAALRASAPRAARWLAAAFMLFLLAELVPLPVAWQEVPGSRNFPPVYSWVAVHPEVRAILELPVQDEAGNTADFNVAYMYFGTLHWKPLVNGYSAWSSRYFAALIKKCCHPVPDDQVIHDLVAAGVTHLIVHQRELPATQTAAFEQWGRERSADLVYADDSAKVYRLAR